ncbi:MAG: hypothetical protein O3A66_01350 [Proteobacteria bacterium]|nr:hypothetical protein [Pseudomonadota bacterium]
MQPHTHSNNASIDDVLRELAGEKYDKAFELKKHDRETKWKITKLFLTWYFTLIIGAFCFCLIYNCVISWCNIKLLSKNMDLIPYIEVSNTVSLITTALSSSVGFVIGYYFKNNGEG